MTIFDDIFTAIAEGIEASIVALISGIILDLINPILEGIGLSPVEI